MASVDVANVSPSIVAPLSENGILSSPFLGYMDFAKQANGIKLSLYLDFNKLSSGISAYLMLNDHSVGEVPFEESDSSFSTAFAQALSDAGYVKTGDTSPWSWNSLSTLLIVIVAALGLLSLALLYSRA